MLANPLCCHSGSGQQMQVDRLRRRQFITLLGGAAAVWPLAAHAQQPNRMRRIGVMMGVPESNQNGQAWLSAFIQGLAHLGWASGRNIHIDTRWGAGDASGVRASAAELVGLKPDAILATGTLATSLLQQETRSIPIVVVLIIDPVASGFAASMVRPAGNITGFTNFEYAIGGKWVEVLKEVAPDTEHIGAVLNPANVAHANFARAIEASASSKRIRVTTIPVRNAGEIELGISSFGRNTKAALIVLPDTVTVSQRDLITGLAVRHRLPSAYPYRDFVAAAGLISYGPDQITFYRQAAVYVDRILKGEKPADLPVQAPTKYELVINLKTAKALGLEVPPMLLARADEVIE